MGDGGLVPADTLVGILTAGGGLGHFVGGLAILSRLQSIARRSKS